MKNKVTELLDDSLLRKRISRNAIKHSSQYRDDVVVKKVHDIYKNVLK